LSQFNDMYPGQKNIIIKHIHPIDDTATIQEKREANKEFKLETLTDLKLNDECEFMFPGR